MRRARSAFFSWRAIENWNSRFEAACECGVCRGKRKGAVASFTTNGQRRFPISLAPGHYTVSMKDKKGKIGRYGPFDIDVIAGQMTKLSGTATRECDREAHRAPR
jgi:hypothetical protein